MLRVVLSCALVAGALFLSFPAHAAGSLTRTFVSSSGVDTNPCTVAQPCATFAAAYVAVAANGIVVALDPGKYGPLTITSPVTIDGNRWGSITASANGSGVLIRAGSSDNVILRGITVDGAAGSANNGIEFDSGGSLTIDHCAARNIGGGADGLDFFNSSESDETLTVVDSQFMNNGFGFDGDGVFLNITSVVSQGGGRPNPPPRYGVGGITASFVRTEFSGNDVGLQVGALQRIPNPPTIPVTVTDSVIANNGQTGVLVGVSQGPFGNLTMTNDQIAGNGTGILANASGITWLAGSTVAGNSVAGFQISSGGVINSYGNNYFANNGSNTGSLTPVNTQ
jgi:Periplasmic copper-binding protein (NosD)